MTTTVFSSGTVIASPWLNDVNNAVYRPDLKTTIGGLTVGSVTLNHSTPSAKVIVTDTNPMYWNAGPGKMSVEFDLTPDNYFAANPNGHFAVVLRCDTDLIATEVRGQGIVCGNATSFPYGPSDLNPTPLLETWMGNLTVPGNYTFPNSETARSLQFLDGVHYRFVIEATKTVDDKRYLRYRVWSFQATYGTWRAEVDTGDVLDHNTWADLTKTGLVFGHVFEDNLSTWSLPFTNVKVTWGPADLATPDQTIKLSRYGAQLEGDLAFIGNGRKIKSAFNAGPALTNSLAVQSATANTSTTLVYLPNGTSTSTNTLYSNNSSSSTTYQALTIGMSGSEGLINTFGLSAANPTINFEVGVGAGVRKLSIGASDITSTVTLVLSGSATRGIKVTGTNTIGIDLASSTNSGSAIRLKDGENIGFDGSGLYKLYHSTTGVTGLTYSVSGVAKLILADDGSIVTANTFALVSSGNTATTATAGGASALPATPSGYFKFLLDGVTMKLPYYAN